MRIHESSTPKPNLINHSKKPIGRVKVEGENQAAVSNQNVSPVKTAEVRELLARLQNETDFRKDKVDQVRDKLASGEFLTETSAQDTAAAILTEL